MKASHILIVDDEPKILKSFTALLTDNGYTCGRAASLEEARTCMERSLFDLILLDIQLPDGNGLEILRESKSQTHAPEVLIVSGQGDIPLALEAVKLGALDFLEKPVPPERLLSSVHAALQLAAAHRQRHHHLEQIEQESPMVGQSKAMAAMRNAISRMAPTDATVLITGENGTGKELVATQLYLESDRREKPFIKVNCPGIPESLFESELFGHLKGSFTGATANYPGKFVLADGGTIFLDEIGDLPLACQAKLLRTLETGEIETIGAGDRRTVDVRVICATNRNVSKLIAENNFRQDLYYRISVLTLPVPSLAERRDDVPVLIGEFLRRFDPTGQTRLSMEAIGLLTAQDYPGNVRQLKNTIERACILHAGREITPELLSADPTGSAIVSEASDEKSLSLQERTSQFERTIIAEALARAEGNISEAARLLQIDRSHLSRKVKEWGLKQS